MGFRQLLVRGFEGVTAEWNLLCLAFNLKRMFGLIRGGAAVQNGSRCALLCAQPGR